MAAGGAVIGGYRGFVIVRTVGKSLEFSQKIAQVIGSSVEGLLAGAAVGAGVLCAVAGIISSRKKAEQERRMKRDETIEDNLAIRVVQIEDRLSDQEDLESRVAELEKQVELLKRQKANPLSKKQAWCGRG